MTKPTPTYVLSPRCPSVPPRAPLSTLPGDRATWQPSAALGLVTTVIILNVPTFRRKRIKSTHNSKWVNQLCKILYIMGKFIVAPKFSVFSLSYQKLRMWRSFCYLHQNQEKKLLETCTSLRFGSLTLHRCTWTMQTGKSGVQAQGSSYRRGGPGRALWPSQEDHLSVRTHWTLSPT